MAGECDVRLGKSALRVHAPGHLTRRTHARALKHVLALRTLLRRANQNHGFAAPALCSFPSVEVIESDKIGFRLSNNDLNCPGGKKGNDLAHG